MKLTRIKNKLYRKFLATLAIAFGFITCGILAIAVTGTINTFSSGQTVKPAEINANFASLRTAIESIPTQKTWRLIYENDVTTTTGSINVTGLDGDSDVEYMINTKFIGAAGAVAGSFFIEVNGDTTACNYKLHHFYVHYVGATVTNGTPACNGAAGFLLSGTAATNTTTGVVFTSKALLFSKSGTKRVALTQGTKALSTTDAWTMNAMQWWENTSSNITSMRFFFSNGTGIGVGSRIEIWAKR